ncbi:MAG: hypothetical protein Q7S51_02520 [Gallionellaceae bacterium]|nr:hypothetical protein [Gallionellaceae bacterium]
MEKNIYAKFLSLRLLSRFLSWRFPLIVLAAIVLGSCSGGGGGGGSQTSSTPTNSVTAVVNQGGGAVTLTDGTTVTFDAGMIKDGTSVTVSSTAPAADPTQEVQPLSSTVVIDVPPDSLLASVPADSVITIEFPLMGNTTQNSVAGFSKATAAGILSGAATKIIQVVTKNINGKTLTYYGQLVGISLGKATVSIGSKITWAGSSIANITIQAMDAIQCTQQSTSLYQVDFSTNGEPNFSTNILRNGKPPLILVHGWQEWRVILSAVPGTATLNLNCSEPYKSTWQTFLQEFSLDPAISDKFQVFSLAYNTSFPIFGNAGFGNAESSDIDFANVIRERFGQEAVYVVAHSSGGLVARSALVTHGANIKGLVTLATPHHGSPLASQEGDALFSLGNTPLHLLIDYVIGGQGVWDIAWDNFDGLLQPPYRGRDNQEGNNFLRDLNTQDSYLERYVVFAGANNEMLGTDIGEKIKEDLGYDNDIVVPVTSALLYTSSNTPDSRLKLQKRFDNLSHHSIKNDVVVLSETRAALLDFLNDTTLPSIPAGLTVTALSSSQINLSWNTSTDDVGVAGYKIYRGGSFITSQTALSYNNTGLSASTQYCYTISAYDIATLSPPMMRSETNHRKAASNALPRQQPIRPT